MAKRFRSLKEWLGVTEKWKLSGLSVKEFCREEGISEGRFYEVRKQIETGIDRRSKKNGKKEPVRNSRQDGKQQFVPVEIKPVPDAVATQRVFNFLEIVTPSGYVIRMHQC